MCLRGLQYRQTSEVFLDGKGQKLSLLAEPTDGRIYLRGELGNQLHPVGLVSRLLLAMPAIHSVRVLGSEEREWNQTRIW